MKFLLMAAVVVVLGIGWDEQAVAAEGKSGVSAEDVKKGRWEMGSGVILSRGEGGGVGRGVGRCVSEM